MMFLSNASSADSVHRADIILQSLAHIHEPDQQGFLSKKLKITLRFYVNSQ